jgi:hypothetical protein
MFNKQHSPLKEIFKNDVMLNSFQGMLLTFREGQQRSPSNGGGDDDDDDGDEEDEEDEEDEDEDEGKEGDDTGEYQR